MDLIPGVPASSKDDLEWWISETNLLPLFMAYDCAILQGSLSQDRANIRYMGCWMLNTSSNTKMTTMSKDGNESEPEVPDNRNESWT